MGYELYISRTLFSPDSERFPIADDEVVRLVLAAPDLVFDAGDPGAREPKGEHVAEGFFFFHWLPPGGEPRWFEMSCGRISTKHPSEAQIRRMIDMAGILDAWVTGDEGEVYGWDGDRITAEEHPRTRVTREPLFINRGQNPEGFYRHRPITQAEWFAVVEKQPDFRVDHTVEAILPSGAVWIPCPPLACWTGHPSGTLVRCFHDEEGLEVEHADAATKDRMIRLAAQLHAKAVFDGVR